MKYAIKYRLLFCAAVLATGCGSETAAPQGGAAGQMNEGGSTGSDPVMPGGGKPGDDDDDNDDLPEYCGWPSAPAPLWPDLGNPGLLAVDDTSVYFANAQQLGDDDVPQPGIYSAPLGGGAPKKLTVLIRGLQGLEVLGDDLVYIHDNTLYRAPKQGGEPTEIEVPEPFEGQFRHFNQLIRHGDELFALWQDGSCISAKKAAVLRLNATHERVELAINVEQCVVELAVDDTHFYWTGPGVVARQGRTDQFPETLTTDIPNEFNRTVSHIAVAGDSVFLVESLPRGATLKSLPKTGGAPSEALFEDELTAFAGLVSHGEKLFGLACGGAFEFSPQTSALRPLATGMTIGTSTLFYGGIAVTDSAVFTSASGNIWRLDRE